MGLPATCGLSANEDCCSSPLVVGGTFDRSNDPAFPATVSDFRLDRFEVTVGRFRKFVEAYPGSKPLPGAGAHPRISGSGWDPEWDTRIPVDAALLGTRLKCNVSYESWTDQPGANETLPINCLLWYEAFAFCAWDGGRLPTEAEWNYAAAAGSEQRMYPWGSEAPDPSYATYACAGDGSPECAVTDLLRVGSKSPKGDGKPWVDGAHADLAGSVREWTLDYADFTICCNAAYTSPSCMNCANLSPPSDRVFRGGGFRDPAEGLSTAWRSSGIPNDRETNRGVRCARMP